MKVISTNIGDPKTIIWRGQKVQTGIYKYSVEGPIYLGNEDVENDNVSDRRYHGGVDKACYGYSSDHYKYWQNFYPDLEMSWGMFGENLTVSGLNESEIFIGDVFRIGEAEVQVTQPRQPCFKLGVRFGTQKIKRQFIDSGFPGVYFRVLKKDSVKAGDEMVLVEKQNALSIQKIFELLYADNFQKKLIEKAIHEPLLAESCRNNLMKRWKDYL